MNPRPLTLLLALCALLAAVPAPSPSPASDYRRIRVDRPPKVHAQGQIEVVGGWAAIKRDLKEAVICLSFRNEAPVTATLVVFELPVVGGTGGTLADLELDRRGTFPQGVTINTWQGPGQWHAGQGPQAAAYDANCKVLKGTAAAFPLLSAHYITYRVRRVEYADGHSWTP